jgi:hypothetical protein
MPVRRCGFKSTRFEIDRLQEVIYLEGAGLNVGRAWRWLKNPKKVRELTYLPNSRFDMGKLTRVKLKYIARIRYDFKLLKILNTINRL